MKAILLSASLLFAGVQAMAAPKVGSPAPEFEGLSSDGKTKVKLSDFKGKYVVLEWWNKDCPFVKKHYGSGNMQGLQTKYTGKDVKWLTILSSAKGKQGYMDAAEATKQMGVANGKPTALLLDPEGKIGRLYEAKTTPHMFVIDPKGTLVYMGAIDDKPTPDPADITGAKNYVEAALVASMEGKPVAQNSTKAYGCSVKY